MNRNTELHFGQIPQINQNRSKFDMSHSHRTTFNDGDIVPIYVEEVLPGDTCQMDMAEVIRMSTPIYPVMDNAVCDIYWFYTPARLLWEHWEEFWGYNPDPWIQTTEYEVPYVESPSGGWVTGSIADYMGAPTYVDKEKFNALYFRAYAKIFSDWFRSEAVQSEAHFYTDDTDRTGSNGTNYVTDVELGGMPAKANKLMDYFTGAMPSPQRGPSVTIPLGATAPVTTGDDQTWNVGDQAKKLKWTPLDANDKVKAYGNTGYYDVNFYVGDSTGTVSEGTTGFSSSSGTSIGNLMPNNLYANLQDATAATINQLRTAFAVQRYYEQLARSGTRYIEFVKAIFGVTSSDSRMQRSEYLGGQRFQVNMDQVIQMSSTDATSPQGNTAGFSCTVHNDSMFTKSFEEHGILMGLAVVRTEKTYQQGLHRRFSRRKKTDYYNPFFAHLSEQGILNKELYCQGDSVVDADGNIIDDQVFGYQEAWAEYRYGQNRVSGAMRSNTPGGGLDAWHYADDYSQLPTLSAGWLEEDKSVVDRTIAVGSGNAPQFIGDFYFKTYWTRCMPVYSYPGLIDHV